MNLRVLTGLVPKFLEESIGWEIYGQMGALLGDLLLANERRPGDGGAP